MNKKLILLALSMCFFSAQAQVRAGAAFGPAFSLKPKDSDTAFFGKDYLNTQLRLGFHKGRLGLVFSGGAIKQSSGNDEVKTRLSGLTGAIYQMNKVTVRNTFFTVGPEICFPLGPIKLHLHCSGGMGWISATDTKITLGGQDTVYMSKLDKTTTGMFKTGINLNYFLKKNVALSVYTEYTSYSIRYNNLDRRRLPGISTNHIQQHKKLLALSGGITYKF